MKSYTKHILTREELVNIIVWPRIENSIDLESDLTKRTIKSILKFKRSKLIKAARKTNLDIICFGNKFAIRYEIN